MQRHNILLSYILVLVALSCPNTVYGQRNESGSKLFNLESEEKQTVSSETDVVPILTSSDTVRYHGVVKQNGWYRGIGHSLTKTEASHLAVHFRMTRKNAAGHWTHIEAIDGYGRLTTNHGLWAYALTPDEGDTLRNKNWVDNMQTICQWDFVYEGKGDKCLMERAYDEDGNLIFSFTPVQVSDSVFIGTYIDDKGRPANLRGDKGASLVRITNDRNGYNAKIELLDEHGYSIKNKDGVIMSQYVYDKDGNMTKMLSCNAVGDPVLDDWGNCGVEYKYDSDGRTIECCCINQYGDPMPMPDTKRNKGNHVGIVRIKYQYDRWGRNISEEYYDENGLNQTDKFGVHKFEMTYNEYGLQTSWKSFDSDGKPTPADSLEVACRHMEFDRQGRNVLFEIFDKYGKYVNNDDGDCKSVHTYSKDGKTVIETDYYSALDGKAVLNFIHKHQGDKEIRKWFLTEEYKSEHPDYFQYRETTPKYEKYQFCNGIVEIDSIDVKHGVYYTAYFNDDGTPAMMNGYHICQSKYKDISDEEYVCVSWAKDSEGEYVLQDTYNAIYIEWWNTKNHTRLKLGYKANQNLATSNFQEWSDDDEQLLSEMSCNYAGNFSRNDLELVEYYKVQVAYNLNEGFSAFVGRNEFDEPSYIQDQVTYYYFLIDQNGKHNYYDEDSKLITDMGSFRMDLPYSTVIEVYDSLGYKKGFKDNDIIVQYGDWYYPLTGVSDRNTSLGLWYEMIKKKNKRKTMTILRYHPEQGTSEVLTKDIDSCGLSEYGVNIHTIPYTRKELERLRVTMINYLGQSGEIDAWRNYVAPDIQSGSPIVISRPENYANGFLWHEAGVRDPYISIASDTISVKENIPKIRMRITSDGESVTEVLYNGTCGSLNYSNFYIPAEDKKKLLELESKK